MLKFLLALTLLFANSAFAQSFILDENEATNAYSWPNGSSQTSVAMGGDYIHDNRSQDGSFVEWNLSSQVTPSSCYKISAIWNANGAGTRATNVRYEIDHDAGTATSYQNQNLNTNTFNVLSTDIGEDTFLNPSKVRVFTGSSPSSEQYIIADAIQAVEVPCDEIEIQAGANSAAFGPGLGADMWTHRMKTLDLWKQHGPSRCDGTEVFVEIGGNTNRGYCIETNERSAASFEEARDDCLSDGKRLPEPAEWKYACTRAGTLGLSDMTVNAEWATNFPIPLLSTNNTTGVMAAAMVNCTVGSFSTVASDVGENLRNYRCVR